MTKEPNMIITQYILSYDTSQAVVFYSQAPFLDVLGTMEEPKLPLTLEDREEWGDPVGNPAHRLSIASYCPLHNITPQVWTQKTNGKTCLQVVVQQLVLAPMFPSIQVGNEVMRITVCVCLCVLSATRRCC